MKCSFVQLHKGECLFHAGKNHGEKLFAKSGLHLDYDRKEKELSVVYAGETTWLPSTSVFHYTPEVNAQNVKEITQISHAQDTRKIKSAQVSTPHGHVFQGEGAGVVRDKK